MRWFSLPPPMDPKDPRRATVRANVMIGLPKFLEPKSPCFLVKDRFFRVYGAQVMMLIAQESDYFSDIRRLEVTSDTSYKRISALKHGESLNIYDRKHPSLESQSFSFATMTPEEIDECSRDYIRIPRNLPQGYQWEYNIETGSMGDTFLASKVTMKKRYPPPEENELPETPIVYK